MTRPGVNDWSSEWEISQFPKICKKKSYSYSLSRLKWNCVNLTQTFDFLRNYLNHWRLTLLILLCAITSFDEIRVYLHKMNYIFNYMCTLFGWGYNFQFCIPIMTGSIFKFCHLLKFSVSLVFFLKILPSESLVGINK